jgi:hypothetical protein
MMGRDRSATGQAPGTGESSASRQRPSVPAPKPSPVGDVLGDPRAPQSSRPAWGWRADGRLCDVAHTGGGRYVYSPPVFEPAESSPSLGASGGPTAGPR